MRAVCTCVSIVNNTKVNTFGILPLASSRDSTVSFNVSLFLIHLFEKELIKTKEINVGAES